MQSVALVITFAGDSPGDNHHDALRFNIFSSLSLSTEITSPWQNFQDNSITAAFLGVPTMSSHALLLWQQSLLLCRPPTSREP